MTGSSRNLDQLDWDGADPGELSQSRFDDACAVVLGAIAAGEAVAVECTGPLEPRTAEPRTAEPHDARGPVSLVRHHRTGDLWMLRRLVGDPDRGPLGGFISRVHMRR